MHAKLENDLINVYNEKDILIGGIKTQSNYKNEDIIIGKKKYQLSSDKWNTKILENGDVKYNLKSNSFLGNTELLETGRKITGVFGLKWGTKMIDNQKNTLIKIRNKSQFIDKKKYEIEVSDNNVTGLEILITLYGHLYGSNIKKQQMFIITAIVVAGVMIWFT